MRVLVSYVKKVSRAAINKSEQYGTMGDEREAGERCIFAILQSVSHNIGQLCDYSSATKKESTKSRRT